ncbi:Arylsulfotransferase (ASST) [Haladaptatus litoreus]|uniref:Arylsulfotransferase (ASST) n=2 Tax=Haladaptatus litoreus TaxID=553468 RepID=A0A1N6VZC2_9EURY|nr:Arylsulfotransferase (ASST) [Haladaptatus litoreus]
MAVSLVSFALVLVVSAAVAPPISKTTTNNAEKTVVGVQSTATEGRVVVLDAAGEQVWDFGHAASYHDVSRLQNGSILASFMARGYDDCGSYESPCAHTGVRIIDPEPNPRIVYEWSFPVRTSGDSEVHDAEFLPTGELLIADMDRERVFTLAPNGTKTWQWNASEFYDSPPDPTRTDWLHINDVDRIGEDRYLVSVRNAHQLLVVERGEGVVEVVNENRDTSVLNYQHNPQWLSENAILVADSENDRIVELHRNESTGQWEPAWQVHDAGGINFDWPRDADRLPNGNTLVTDSRNNRIVELNESGEMVWSARVPTVPYEADRDPGEYPAGEPADSEGVVGSGTTKLPVFSYLLDSARHVVALPYWLAGWHLAVGFVAFVTFVVGFWLVVRGRKRQ